MSQLTRKEEQVLLAIFHIGLDAYLIPIQAKIKLFTGKNYSVGTIYAPLNRLHLNGLLETYFKKQTGPNAGKPIKCYRLTEKGEMALQVLRDQQKMMWKGVSFS
ncbi:PadR family transcriptional regulator [bacterium]|nr:PadR family transcriptional regulator [bacterium]